MQHDISEVESEQVLLEVSICWRMQREASWQAIIAESQLVHAYVNEQPMEVFTLVQCTRSVSRSEWCTPAVRDIVPARDVAHDWQQ